MCIWKNRLIRLWVYCLDCVTVMLFASNFVKEIQSGGVFFGLLCVCLIKGKENTEWFDYTENDFSRLRTAGVCLKVTKLLRYNKGFMGSYRRKISKDEMMCDWALQHIHSSSRKAT